MTAYPAGSDRSGSLATNSSGSMLLRARHKINAHSIPANVAMAMGRVRSAGNASAFQLRSEQIQPLFLDNTAAFIHELLTDSLGNANGDTNYVRVEVLTPVSILDRDKKIGVIKDITAIIADAAGDPSLANRTWVLIVEAPDGGWGINSRANTNADIAETARKILTGK